MRIVVLTGAGLSAESGIPTFRDAQTGIWARYDPMQLATPAAFAANPQLVHRFYTDRRAAVHGAAPNLAHAALARLQRELQDEVMLCTQNVDDLLERGGCSRVLHMHGSLFEARCLACAAIVPWQGAMDTASICPVCEAARLRPNVVWFGEIPLFLDAIADAIAQADLFVAIGTSGTVYPAAGLVDLARDAGAMTAELNLVASDRADAFDAVTLGPATVTVPEWVDAVLRSLTP